MGGRLRIRMVKNGRIAGAFRAKAVIFTPLPAILLTLGLTHILAAIVRPGRGLRALLRLLLLLLGRRLISGLGAVGFGDSGRTFDLHLGDADGGETCVKLQSVAILPQRHFRRLAGNGQADGGAIRVVADVHLHGAKMMRIDLETSLRAIGR